MNDEAALIRAIIADPDNDLPRLVYADWLEEHGRSERAELIRIQCEQASLRISDPMTASREAELARRFGTLIPRIEGWLKEFKTTVPAHRLTWFWFRRGMPAGLACTLKYFVENAEAVLAGAPIQTVSFTRPSPKALASLVTHPAWPRVRQVMFSVDELTEAGMRAFLALPLSHLRSLVLAGNSGTDDPSSAGWSSRSEGKIVLLAASRGLQGLERLDLSRAGIGEAGADGLCRSDALADIRFLLLFDNPIAEPNRSRLRERFGDRVFFDVSEYGRLTHEQLMG